MVSTDLASYYRLRAAEYEGIYHKPERQDDLARLRRRLAVRLQGLRVLELACGTGYWTAVIAATVTTLLATDINPEVLAIARRKPLPAGRVRLQQLDADTLAGLEGEFDAVLAAFWWSHVPHQRLADWLERLRRRLPGTRLVILDNRFATGSSTPISRVDEAGNSYQRRQLADGRSFEVLKNFPDESALRGWLQPVSDSFAYQALTYYWLAEARLTQHRGSA